MDDWVGGAQLLIANTDVVEKATKDLEDRYFAVRRQLRANAKLAIEGVKVFAPAAAEAGDALAEIETAMWVAREIRKVRRAIDKRLTPEPAETPLFPEDAPHSPAVK